MALSPPELLVHVRRVIAEAAPAARALGGSHALLAPEMWDDEAGVSVYVLVMPGTWCNITSATEHQYHDVWISLIDALGRRFYDGEDIALDAAEPVAIAKGKARNELPGVRREGDYWIVPSVEPTQFDPEGKSEEEAAAEAAAAMNSLDDWSAAMQLDETSHWPNSDQNWVQFTALPVSVGEPLTDEMIRQAMIMTRHGWNPMKEQPTGFLEGEIAEVRQHLAAVSTVVVEFPR